MNYIVAYTTINIVNLVMDQKVELKDIDVVSCINMRIRMLNRLVNKMYAEPLRPIGISTAQQNILFLVGKMKKVSQQQIGKMLFLEKSTVTRELNALRTRGFIRKSDELPSFMVELTKSGNQLIELMIPQWLRVQGELLKIIGKGGSESINKLLKSLQ